MKKDLTSASYPIRSSPPASVLPYIPTRYASRLFFLPVAPEGVPPFVGRPSVPLIKDQTRITVAVEAVSILDSFLVGPQYQVGPGERANQYEERGPGEVKVGDHPPHRLE